MTVGGPKIAGRLPWAARVILLCAALAGGPLRGAEPAPQGSEIAEELREFRVFGSVLYVAAHPDDENTQLITFLSRGRAYRTAYLSLTRGDGGQNVLGPEFGDLLGVIRTQELLAARRVDGGVQFFSRARDFGYSKDYRQTLTKWDRTQVLSDIVRVIRTFRPDILVTRFSPEPGGTHGHHTASAALALEAFKLAGDPKAFPEQLTTLSTWQPRRILWNGWNQSRPGSGASLPDAVHMVIDGTDAVNGASFATLAAKSRSMHRTQGFANFSVAAAGTGVHTESFFLLAGDPATADIMDGVDTTWGRISGGGAIAQLADAAAARFDPSDPSASVPALLALRQALSGINGDPVAEEKKGLLDKIIQKCLGLTVTTRVQDEEIVPGEPLRVWHHVRAASSVPVQWVGIRLHGLASDKALSLDLSPAAETRLYSDCRLPESTPLSQPYWLRSEETPGMFTVADQSLIGTAENPPLLPVDYVFRVGGQELVVRDEALYAPADVDWVPSRPFAIPPVTLSFPSGVELFARGSSRTVTLEVMSARPGQRGSVSLNVPSGWSVSPASREFQLETGKKAVVAFQVTAPAAASRAAITATATVGGASYSSGRIKILYPHIPPQLVQSPARLWALSLDFAAKGRTVAYLPGAGDSTEASLAAMGYRVTRIDGADLTPDRLRAFDAVVIGVRAFNVRTDLAAGLPALFGYVVQGGTVVEQYNTPGGLQAPQLAPYPLKLARDLPRFRVTDEKSDVTLLAPGDPAFNSPNHITAEDFEGWVQERGLDFASEWDTAHFTPLLSCSDPGEAQLRGGLLVCRMGKGHFVYTGLSFFRQLPAGVPGAYRLFANLVSLGR